MAEIIKINENTWRIEDGMVRFFLLTGTEKALFIDSGVTGADLKEIAAQITDLPLELLNTHADPDHVAGNNQFDWFYMYPSDEELARSKGVKGKLVPLTDGQIIDLGERPLRILHIPGHTAGSVAVLDINNRALFSGDSVQEGNIYMFGPRRNMDDLLASLDRLDKISLGFDVIYPSHDDPQVGTGLIKWLMEGAKDIIDGKAEGIDQDLFGNPITWYSFPYGGFYCDRK